MGWHSHCAEQQTPGDEQERTKSVSFALFFIEGLKRKTKEKTTWNTTQQGDRKVHKDNLIIL